MTTGGQGSSGEHNGVVRVPHRILHHTAPYEVSLLGLGGVARGSASSSKGGEDVHLKYVCEL
jgi:hypothetical protein